MLNEESITEIIEALPTLELKLNILALLGSFEFIKELMKYNQISTIFPYAKVIVFSKIPIIYNYLQVMNISFYKI